MTNSNCKSIDAYKSDEKESSSSDDSSFSLHDTSFGDYNVNVLPYKTLNTCKGVIYCPDLLNCSVEEISNCLEDQGVVEVKRVSRKKDGKTVETASHILTFEKSYLPKYVTAAFYRSEVRPYMPNPLRCFKCQKFGHVSDKCENESICACGKQTHEETLITKNDEIMKQNDILKEELKTEINSLKTDLSTEVNLRKEENIELKKENTILKQKIKKIEQIEKKYKLVVYELKEPKEKREDINNFLELINQKLELTCTFQELRDFYRIGKIIPETSSNHIRKDYNNQKLLHKYLKKARENKKEAKIKNNILYVNGETYTLDDLLKEDNEIYITSANPEENSNKVQHPHTLKKQQLKKKNIY
ncbi:unnamed protein product [Brassicogethes aeneus]|uniref:CCHC-type domain-containing protein n=1 Tax=Brassicogethes aeneus TaxID=1431903 RepID=A0A9P0B635_BRAAE|nr:unnamed protein product [Brassicogethes aeneus]